MTCDDCIYGKRVFDNFTGQYYYECSYVQLVRKIGDYSYFETASSKTIEDCPCGKAKQIHNCPNCGADMRGDNNE